MAADGVLTTYLSSGCGERRNREEVYLNEYRTVWQAEDRLRKYFEFYNHRRLDQALDYKTPAEVYRQKRKPRCHRKLWKCRSYGKRRCVSHKSLEKPKAAFPPLPQPAAARYKLLRKKGEKNQFIKTPTSTLK